MSAPKDAASLPGPPQQKAEQPNFATDLFESVDAVCAFVDENIRTIQEMRKFFHRRAKAEEEYSRLAALVQRESGDHTSARPGSVGARCAALIQQVRATADARTATASSIALEICEILGPMIVEFAQSLKKLQADGARNAQNYRNTVARLDKAKAVCAKACRDRGPDNVPIRMLAEYHQQVDKANEAQRAYLKLNSEVLDQLQLLDKRVQIAMQNAVDKYIKLLKDAMSIESDRFEAIIAGFSDQSHSRDVLQLVEQKRSSAPPPFTMLSLEELAKAAEKSGKASRGWARRKSASTHSLPSSSSQHPVAMVGRAPPSLDETMERQKDDYPALDVPVFVVMLRDSLRRMDAYHSEGLFRIPGDQQELVLYSQYFDQDTFRIIKARTTVHTLATLFKYYIREMPNPLIPTLQYERLVMVGPDLNPENVEALVLDQLPLNNRNLLVFLVGFLQELLPYSEVTKMGCENLAMVFAPCVLKCPADHPALLLQFYESAISIMSALIKHVPKSLVERLSTVITNRPDGSPYDGSGFEEVEKEAQLRVESQSLSRSESSDSLESSFGQSSYIPSDYHSPSVSHRASCAPLSPAAMTALTEKGRRKSIMGSVGSELVGMFPRTTQAVLKSPQSTPPASPSMTVERKRNLSGDLVVEPTAPKSGRDSLSASPGIPKEPSAPASEFNVGLTDSERAAAAALPVLPSFPGELRKSYSEVIVPPDHGIHLTRRKHSDKDRPVSKELTTAQKRLSKEPDENSSRSRSKEEKNKESKERHKSKEIPPPAPVQPSPAGTISSVPGDRHSNLLQSAGPEDSDERSEIDDSAKSLPLLEGKQEDLSIGEIDARRSSSSSSTKKDRRSSHGMAERERDRELRHLVKGALEVHTELVEAVFHLDKHLAKASAINEENFTIIAIGFSQHLSDVVHTNMRVSHEELARYEKATYVRPEQFREADTNPDGFPVARSSLAAAHVMLSFIATRCGEMKSRTAVKGLTATLSALRSTFNKEIARELSLHLIKAPEVDTTPVPAVLVKPRDSLENIY
eukprot:m51a1_g2336 hypothetical protein (1030) ;mRNA; r:539990-543689